VEFAEEPTPVRREVKYVPINNNSEQGGVILSENKKTPCCPEKVKLLIQSEHTPYQESDKEFLESLDEARVDQLAALAEAATPVEKDETEEEAPQINNTEQAITVLKEEGVDVLSLLPEEEQETIAASKALFQKTKQALIDGIVANSEYTKDELASWKMPGLEKLAKALKVNDKGPKPSFAGLGAGSHTTQTDVEPLLPVFAEESKGGAS
jgi:hypothetical protein